MNPQTLYRLTKTGLDWYRKNRVLNRQRTSSQKNSRCIWEVILSRLSTSAATSKSLFEPFIVDGHSPWYAEDEVMDEIALLLDMGYITAEPAPDLDAIGLERVAREAKVIKECGRHWQKRNERMRIIDHDTLIRLDEWFCRNPNWPGSPCSD